MPVLEEKHDFAHPVEGDSAWSESYYFNCYDPVTDSGFYTRIGVRPNEGTMDVGHHVWLPDNGFAAIRGVREQKTMTDVDLTVGDVSYERVVPAKEWRLRCDATVPTYQLRTFEPRGEQRIAMDVTFSALTPMIGGDGQGSDGEGASVKTKQVVGKGHLEQAGRWTGWISVGDSRLSLGDARGNRDKSWGPRRWGGPLMWRWFSINLSDDVHFGGIRIGTEDGDLHRGWVWKDGGHSSIRRWDVRSELEDDGVTHRVSHVTALDADGRSHQLRADLLRVSGLPPGPNRTVVNEGLARWTSEGLTGYGISEYLHQLDGEGKPRVPIE